MPRRLKPAEMYPAGVPDVRVFWVTTPEGVRLRVAEAGDPEAPPVLLIHGWCELLFTFRHALEELPRAGFRAIAPDLRGAGLSDKPRAPGAYRQEALRGDLIFLMDALATRRPAVVGHSLGGGIALDLAMHHPERVRALTMI